MRKNISAKHHGDGVRAIERSNREEQYHHHTVVAMLQSISAVRARALQGSLRLRAAGASAKGGAAKAKKSRAADAPAAPMVSKELREKAVLGANILKDGSDPQILPESEYPEWLNGMLEKRPPLSELQRRKPETMALPELMRLLKLDNRRRIKQNNGLKAKK